MKPKYLKKTICPVCDSDKVRQDNDYPETVRCCDDCGSDFNEDKTIILDPRDSYEKNEAFPAHWKPRIEVFVDSGDWVKCNWCDKIMLLPSGAEKCPKCNKEGCLAWMNEILDEPAYKNMQVAKHQDLQEAGFYIIDRNELTDQIQYLSKETLRDEFGLDCYRLPHHWLGALFNDDYSGLTEEEAGEVKKFLSTVDGNIYDFDEKSIDFSATNDAGTKACECADFYFENNNN